MERIFGRYQISLKELNYILGLDYDRVFYLLKHKYYCLHCNYNKSTALNIEEIWIEKLEVFINGKCSHCQKKLMNSANWHADQQADKRLKEILKRPSSFGQASLGSLSNNHYKNDLINWEVSVPEKYVIQVDTSPKNKRSFSKKLLTISYASEELQLFIRPKLPFEKLNFRKRLDSNLNILTGNFAIHKKLGTFPTINFDVQKTPLTIDGKQFAAIEFSEVIQKKKVIAMPKIQLLGLKNGFIMSFYLTFAKERRTEFLSFLYGSRFI